MTDEDVLPQSSENQDQERTSFARLATLVPTTMFLLREETGGDFGTDRILELIEDGRVTNIRVHVQGKSARALSPNKNGSFSYGIPLKTIRYLRRQPCSVVFLYLADQDRFLWAWISEVWKAMKTQRDGGGRARPSRRKRKKRQSKKEDAARTAPSEPSFTYRFVKPLDRDAFDEMHATALRQGAVVERLSEVFALRGQDGQAIVTYATNEVTDVAELLTFLRKHGYSLASTGKGHLVDDLVAKLPGSVRDDPDIRPILAFSKLIQGQATEALALTRCEPTSETPTQKQERTMVRATAEHALGITTTTEYLEAMREARAFAPETVFALQVEIHELREEIFESLGARLNELLTRVRQVVARLESRPEVDEDVRLSAQLVLWELDGFENRRAEASLLAWLAANSQFSFEPEQAMRMSASHARDREEMARRRAAWIGRGRTLRARVSQRNNPLFAARMDMATAIEFTQAMASLDGEPTAEDSETSKRLEQCLRSGVEHLIQVGSVDVAARLELVRADVLGVMGDAEGERTANLAAQQLARQIGSRWLENRASEALAGRHTAATNRATYAAIRNGRSDRDHGSAADSTPAERDQLAALLVRTQDLPRARLPFVRKAVETEHVMAREARTWCRHLRYLEGMGHRASRVTTFSCDPDRWCVCTLHRYESQVSHPDIDVLLTAFKRSYCQGCPSRAPSDQTTGPEAVSSLRGADDARSPCSGRP